MHDRERDETRIQNFGRKGDRPFWTGVPGKHRQEDIIKMDLKEIRCEVGD
jgi:hypothetical protein